MINRLQLSEEQIDNIIDLALAEDISHGDVTSQALISPDLQGKASIQIKAKGILAGGEVAKRVFLKVPDLQGKASIQIKAKGILAGGEVANRVFLRVDPSLKVEVLIKDGTRVKPGDIAATIFGSVASILKAERVALNFLQRLSGIASQTAQYVAKTRGLVANITDTRKTTPGLRLLEKYAVRMGGGQNHRFHLGDGILIKDNHIAALRALGMSLKDIIAKAKQNSPQGLTVEVEVTTLQEALEATGIVTNRNSIPFDSRPPWASSGIRLGTPAVTTRGFGIEEMKQIASLIVRVVSNIQSAEVRNEVVAEVLNLTSRFPVPGIEV